MPTRWDTFPVSVQGGLVTNVAPLRQGMEMPGSARSLINFEASVEGGYKRILGFNKYSDTAVPVYGEPVVQGSGQTGTTLDIANIAITPTAGDTFTISGVTGTYEIASGGVSFSGPGNSATLTLTSSLASSPADKAAITFTNNTSTIYGVKSFNGETIVARQDDIWTGIGSGWTKLNVPSYGTVLTAGGAQTGTSFSVDGLTSAPLAGDTFSISGVELVYTVTADATLTGDAATLTITPALDSSPADNAPITFLSTERDSVVKRRFIEHTFSNVPTLLGVDGTNLPFKYDGTTFTNLTAVPSEVVGAEHIEEFKNHIFLSKDTYLVFSAPFSDTDYTPANGGGVINLPFRITGLKVFREQLLVFCVNQIYRIVGNTVSDFTLQPISKTIGCTREDTIQEVGGDIIFMAQDGLRFLSATDRIGDFGMAVASRPIQRDVANFLATNTSFCSLIIRGKNQYRVLGYNSSYSTSASQGFIGVQFADQTAQNMAWSKTVGIKAFVADSTYEDGSETILFAGDTGYVYRLESSNGFDGASINAYYYTPYFAVNDPKIRKTFYTLTSYIHAEGNLDGTATVKYDFNNPNVIQPPSVSISDVASNVAFYGSATYGSGTYGTRLVADLENQIIGSGFTISIEYAFEGTDPPFSIDSIAIEFKFDDRQ